MKAFSTFLFFAAMLLAGALTLGLSGCTHHEKNEPPPAPPAKTTPAPITTGPVSVDFDRAPLADVVHFITLQTGRGFILGGLEETPVSWIEYHIPREKLFSAFTDTLAASGLVLKPANESNTAYTIDKAEEVQVPFKLDFATSARGTWFLLGSTVYAKEAFPFPVQYNGGHWYATIPKSVADSMRSSTTK